LVGTSWCGGVVPVALLVVILVLIKSIMYLFNLKNKEKEVTMDTMKNVKIILNTGLTSLVETFWAIGTSIASAGVLHTAIHICNSHEPTLRPKIAKEYVLPTHGRNETCSKFERKTTEMKESQPLTMAIRNAGKVLKMNIIVINKISGKLKVWYFKTPHYA